MFLCVALLAMWCLVLCTVCIMVIICMIDVIKCLFRLIMITIKIKPFIPTRVCFYIFCCCLAFSSEYIFVLLHKPYNNKHNNITIIIIVVCWLYLYKHCTYTYIVCYLIMDWIWLLHTAECKLCAEDNI